MARLVGIGAVWFGCALAWVILGSTLIARSGESSAALSPEVHQLWGPPVEQVQPTASYATTRMVRSTRTVHDEQGNARVETTAEEERVDHPVPLVASDLQAELDLEHRQRGLVWFPTFEVRFQGRYTFENPDAEARDVTFVFPLQSENTIYDAFRVTDAEGREVPVRIEGTASWVARVEPGQRAMFDVRYRTRGTGTWHYRMAYGTARITDFRLAVTTNFDEVDFPAGTLSPSSHGPHEGGWRGTWQFDSLIANQPIGVEPPARINPGPLAARITFFAPVGLLFFFFVVAVLAVSQRRDLHPMHFFFFGCAFFAFHLSFAYLVDHLSIGVSFAISTAVSTLLIVTYARLFVGWRFALREMGIAQLLYLVLFSATFLWEGFTGLAITVGAIITLFVMMQITGRIAWGKKPEPTAAPPPPAPAGASAPAPTVF